MIYDFSDFLENNYLYTFHAKSPEDFYLGTSDNGLIHVKDGEPEIFFKDHSVYTIVETPNGIIFSVENDGVYVMDNNAINNLSDQFFLRSNDIYNISHDFISQFLMIYRVYGCNIFNNYTSYLYKSIKNHQSWN